MLRAKFRYILSGLWLLCAVVIGGLSLAPAVLAVGAIAQSYQPDTTDIGVGTLVSLVSSGSNKVTPANSTSNSSLLVGVAASKPLVELATGSPSSVQVVVEGSTQALVSDINGAVHSGDKITASPVSGVGMKAIDAAEVVGTAQADLDSVTTVNRTVVNKDGEETTIKVGLLPVAVNVTYYSTANTSFAASLVPPILQAAANAVAGKQVSPMKVLLGTLVIVLGFITVVVMVYVAIRNGVVSIGRNPLAEQSLRKGLLQVLAAAIGVLVVTAGLAYAIILIN